MTIGIYKLSFNGTDKVYIGQSKNIEQRFREHKSSLKYGKSSPKLQEAYSLYGIPSLTILEVCLLLELDAKEAFYITKFNSIDNGFNSIPGGTTPTYKGDSNPQARYANDDYAAVLYYLASPGYSWKQVAEITGVSEYVISHISSQESHGWLSELYPVEWAKVSEIRKTSGRNTAFMQGIRYPKVLSPEGILYEVHCPTHFAKEHGLLQPKLHELLTGTRPIHRGWVLEGSNHIKYYPKIKSPLGDVYEVQIGRGAAFAKEHGLNNSNLNSVLNGKAKSHKGWTLA